MVGRKFPSNTMIAIHGFLEGRPSDGVGGGVRVGNPNAADIVDVAFICTDVGMLVQYTFFVNSEVKRSVIACGWSTHCSTTSLMPNGVSECENVQLHDEAQGGHKRFDGRGAEGIFVISEVSTYFS